MTNTNLSPLSREILQDLAIHPIRGWVYEHFTLEAITAVDLLIELQFAMFADDNIVITDLGRRALLIQSDESEG